MCSDVCIKPFYKELKYKNYNDTILDETTQINDYFKAYITTLSTKSGGSKIINNYENKYIKYKNKYLNLKNNGTI